MSLPSGYKRLDYIQSSGTQYINTGFKPNNNTRVVMNLLYTGSESISNEFGAWNSSNNASFICLTTGKNNLYPFYGNTSKQVSANRTARHTVDMDKNVVKMNGTTMITFDQMSFQCTYPMFLCCFNNVGATENMTSMRIYSCQIYDNGTLVRDYIPCQTTSGDIGLWDDVNSVFYGNAGTGAFTAGPVIAIAAALSDITQLEFIKSSGKQYINTAFPPNQRTRVVCDTVFAAVSAGTWLFGVRHDHKDRTFGFLTYLNNYRSDFGTSVDETITETQSGRFTVDKDGNITKINGTTVKTAPAGMFQCSHSLFLFANNDNGTVGGYGTATVYSCQIYDNGTLSRNYIAAKLSDGTIGLYDKLHDLLYINLGTGTFTAGPVVVPNPPANLQQTLAVRLTWSAVPSATSYNVYRDGTLLGSTTETSFVDITAEVNQEYIYGVSAVNPGGESAQTVITIYTKSGYFLYKPYVESATFQ